ncbi:MAG: FAD-dependent oxidoreductase [Ruminiclostridium sp.]|nr:FAD-dependent oxidoreductase [Ruminiclostridium sp.]
MNKRLAGYDCKMFIQLGKKKNIVIVGGGVAGMEAAHVVMLRGHDVTIYEKSDIFG